MNGHDAAQGFGFISIFRRGGHQTGALVGALRTFDGEERIVLLGCGLTVAHGHNLLAGDAASVRRQKKNHAAACGKCGRMGA